jgi:hypothetical protein
MVILAIKIESQPCVRSVKKSCCTPSIAYPRTSEEMDGTLPRIASFENT